MLMSYLMQMRSAKGLSDTFANYGAGNGNEEPFVGLELSPMLMRVHVVLAAGNFGILARGQEHAKEESWLVTSCY